MCISNHQANDLMPVNIFFSLLGSMENRPIRPPYGCLLHGAGPGACSFENTLKQWSQEDTHVISRGLRKGAALFPSSRVKLSQSSPTFQVGIWRRRREMEAPKSDIEWNSGRQGYKKYGSPFNHFEKQLGNTRPRWSSALGHGVPAPKGLREEALTQSHRGLWQDCRAAAYNIP